MKIYIKKSADIELPSIIEKGDWIDLMSAETHNFTGPQINADKVVYDYYAINLGVAMKLPAGFEAHVLPRSSLFKRKGLTMVNSEGIIDVTYQGNEDIWHFPAQAHRKTTVFTKDKIAQFRIELSQKATIWQKLRWLFSNRIELVEVSSLPGENRGGLGSTGGM